MREEAHNAQYSPIAPGGANRKETNMEFTCSRCAVKVGVEFEVPAAVMDTCVYCGSGPTSAEMATAVLLQLKETPKPLAARAAAATSAWLTAEEAAAFLRVPSVRALYQLVRRGVVQASRVGRALRFRRADLEELLVGAAADSPARVGSPE